MTTTSITLTTRLSGSATDHRRGIVRLHPEVMDALGIRAWDAVRLTGARETVALAASAGIAEPTGLVTVDDITLTNLGGPEGTPVTVRPQEVHKAAAITVTGSRLAVAAVGPETIRSALIGKVVLAGDTVSLRPQDVSPNGPGDAGRLRVKLSNAIGATWTNELVTIAGTDPADAVAVHPATVVTWRSPARGDAPETEPRPGQEPAANSATTHPTSTMPREPTRDGGAPSRPVVPPSDLVGARQAADRLDEWLRLSFGRPELLSRLGAPVRVGVLISGPPGAGKATLARSVTAAVGAEIVELTGPWLAAVDSAAAADRVRDAVRRARQAATQGSDCVLLITDVETLLPATDTPPLATVVLETLSAAAETDRLSIVVTSANPAAVDPRLRETELVARELTVPMPDEATRIDLLRVLLRDTPLGTDVDLGRVAERTPGFVAADLRSLCREAAVQAALAHHTDEAAEGREPRVRHEDFMQAVSSVRPISMSTSDSLSTGGVGLDDVGDMREVKRALTETVLWPLRYPDSFARLGIQPARGVLLHGPPGCGKTFLVRALAGSGRLNVLAVKGAELLDKWVGESERAVRELFLRAANAAPTLVFLDEIDALAPKRGQSADSGVTDRVVAALLAELDGIEPMRDVVVVGATNRPELVDPALLRPGRLERAVAVAPPDAGARAEILRASCKNTPLAGDVDLDELAVTLEGYSAADCASLVREAALTALRASLEAAEVGAAHFASARKSIRASLDREQLAAPEEFSNR